MNHNTLFVGDFMKPNPICLLPDMDILHAVSLLLNNHVSGAAVVDHSGKLVGILTERDCIQVAVQAGYFNDFGGQVSDYMNPDVATVSVKDNLMDVAEKFINSSFHRYPVMDQDVMVGLISRRDVLSAMQQNIIK